MLNLNYIRNYLYFSSKVVLRGQAIHLEVHTYLIVEQLCAKLVSRGWINLFYDIEPPVFEIEVVEFYENLATVKGDVASSIVCGVHIFLTNLS